MALPRPSSLSPSKLSTFTSCGLHFRFSTVERLAEPPTEATTRGSLVHLALEHLFTLPEDQRVPSVGDECVDLAHERLRDDPEWTDLELSADDEARVLDEARGLVQNYFRLEDPRTVVPVGVELALDATIGGTDGEPMLVRGIIDRLDLVDGELVVTDYKTGRAPSDTHARSRMTGVHIYALLCEHHLGRRPARVQLLHLQEPVAIVTEPTEQSTRALERRLGAVWSAIGDACDAENFAPRPSALCTWCSFQEYCPAFGGDPDQARVDRDVIEREEAGQASLLPRP